MEFEEILNVINKAIIKSKVVRIQTNNCDSNGTFDDLVVGKISGFTGDEISLISKSNGDR